MNITDISQRARVIRAATPNCLEELFEMQNRICDLCRHAIQDLSLASLDHSTPVVLYARNMNISTDDAIRECNNPVNLRAAHSLCNSAKGQMTREDWFLKGKDKEIDQPCIYTESELLELRFRMGAGGRTVVKSGQLASLRTHEHQSKAGRAAAKINIENGQLDRIRKLPQTIFAQAEVGRKNAESGKMKALGKQYGPEQGRINGTIQGRKNVESGHIVYMRSFITLESMKKRGLQSCHQKWHVNRGIVSPTCELCKQSS